MTIQSKTRGRSRPKKYIYRRTDVSAARKIDKLTELRLQVAAAGLCQFPACRKSILAHESTQAPLNIGEKAHIVAFSANGPRGDADDRPSEINGIDNLMLLCPDCHMLVDSDVDRFPVSELRRFKSEHESDVRVLQSLMRSNTLATTIIRFTAPIGGKPAEIPTEHLHRAIFPNRPRSSPLDISLSDSTPLPESDMYEHGKRLITQRVRQIYGAQTHDNLIQHLSLFGLAPIPLLVHFGFEIGRDLPAAVYNRQHDTDDWRWKTDHPGVKFSLSIVQRLAKPSSIAILVSFSGNVHASQLPAPINSEGMIYAITPDDELPSKNLARVEQTVANFRQVYEQFLATVRAEHPSARHLHLFAAVPPAVAITIGQRLIAKVDPTLVLYDWRRDCYVKTIEVNQYEQQ